MADCPHCNDTGFIQEEDPGFRRLVGKVPCRFCDDPPGDAIEESLVRSHESHEEGVSHGRG